MKEILSPFFIALFIFLLIDIIWISLSVKFLYKPAFGELLNEKPVLWAAILFYIIYVFGLTLIIIKPAINYDSLTHALLMGAIFGLVAYGTYNLTNMAIIKNWSPKVVFIDMAWGTFLTSITSAATFYFTKFFLN